MAATRDWLSGIYEISKVINASLELSEVLSVIARETARFVQFDRLSIALLVDGGQRLRLYVPVAPDETRRPDGTTLDLKGHAFGHVVQTREPLILPDLRSDARFPADRALIEEGAISCVILPLVSSDKVLGGVAIVRYEFRPFSQPDIDMLLEVAEQTALAVEHAHVYAVEKKRAGHLAIINQVAKRVLSTFDLDSLLQQTASLIQHYFDYYDVSIFMVDKTADEVALRAQAGAYRELSAVGYRQPIGTGMVGWTARMGKTLLASDVAQNPHYIVAFEGERNARSELCVPIKIGGETVGVINVESTQVGAFDQIDVTAIETLSDQVAQAIENARLYDEMRYLKELDESILASIPASILVVDRSYTILSVNEMCCHILERPREDILGENFEGLFHFDLLDSAILRRAVERVIDGDQRASFTAIRVQLPTGRTRVADIYLSPVARRTQRRALIFFNDITDRRRAEEDVLREKQKLNDIVSAMGAGLVLIGRDLTVVWSNQTVDQWFGGSHSLVGRKCHEVYRGHDSPCRECKASLTFATGETQTSGYVAVMASTTRHFQCIYAPIRDETGKISQVIMLTFDVTEHARKVEQISLLQKLSRAMEGILEIDRLLHLILTCVTAGPGLGFNRAILLLVDDSKTVLEGRLGVGPGSVEEASRIWRDLGERAQTLENLLALFEEPHPPTDTSMQYVCQQIRIPMSATDQVPVRALIEKRPLAVKDAAHDPGMSPHLRSLLAANQFVCVPLVARDEALGAIIADNVFTGHTISDEEVDMLQTFAAHAALAISAASAYSRLEDQLNQLEEAQDRLVRSERLATVGRLAAHVAHEIRNPLATIGGFARSILKSSGDPAKAQRNARIIVEEVERLEQILANVMNFSKPGNPVLRDKKINEIVDAVCTFHENLFAERRVLLHKSLDPRCPTLRLDPDQMRQVLLNLVQNAVDSMPNGGELTVLTRALQDRVEIVIADTGQGMGEDVLESLFQPFFTTKVGGTGLGLSVSQKIVHDHGGDIFVRSKPGAGSSFTISLPVRAAQSP
jgi:PAS domain S-box-containing protein